MVKWSGADEGRQLKWLDEQRELECGRHKTDSLGLQSVVARIDNSYMTGRYDVQALRIRSSAKGVDSCSSVEEGEWDASPLAICLSCL